VIAALTIGGCFYAVLTIAGLIISGMPVAFWKGALRPVLAGTLITSDLGKKSHMVYRVMGTLGLVVFLALLTIVMSPLSAYRALWEIWHWAMRTRGGPPPPREPAVAKRVRAL
jgi:hypothetical protein